MTDTLPPTRATASARIAAGHKKDPTQHAAQRLARAYEHDAEMEALAALRDDPARWAALPQGSRLSVGYYLGSKAAAQALGVDTSAPKDAA